MITPAPKTKPTARKGKAPLQYPPEDDEDYDDEEG